MTTYRFEAYALTPVHVGCGRQIDPTEFVLVDDKILQVNLPALLEDLSPEERHRFTEFLDRADLKEIHNFVRHQAKKEHHVLGQVDAGEEFRRIYAAKCANPDNQFLVEMMPRNPHTGIPMLPGSGIKGAIRTAVINYFVNFDSTTSAKLKEKLKGVENKKRGQILEEVALDRLQRNTQGDVFRLVHVEDVSLPYGSTRIDRATNINPGNPNAGKIQMWVERLKSQADMKKALNFEVKLRIDTRAMSDPRVERLLGRKLDIDLLFKACNHFYWGRMTAEGDKFDKRREEGQPWKAIHNLFPKARFENGGIETLDPTSKYWENPYIKRKRMLLRVGRFSHFESLSVDNYRQGFNIQTKRPIHGMGSTRTRCIIDNRNDPVPFGWILMTLDAEKISEP